MIFSTPLWAILIGIGCCLGVAEADPYRVPLTEFGQPDLQGTWTNATISRLERPDQYGNTQVMSEAQARDLEAKNSRQMAQELQPSDPNAPAFAAGSTVAGYDAYWIDPGNKIIRIDGQYRTSIITVPEDGKIPYSAAGRAGYETGMARRENFDNPETRPLGERCLVGFGSTGGPPMLPVLYNNHYQIVQNEDHVMIMVEMNHDLRIIKLGQDRYDASLGRWLGDSVGHWEGNTLVVETRHFHPLQYLRSATKHRFYIPSSAVVTERFTRISQEQILYQFTVADDIAYTQPWSGEMPFNATDENIFEYACHEGNFSLPGILQGAREKERAALK